MAQYIVTAPDGKEITLEGPSGASQADVIAQAQKLYNPQSNTGNIITSDVPTVVGEIPNPPMAQEPKRTMMDYVKALGEVPATIGSGIISQPASIIYGLGRSAIEGALQGQMPSPQARDEYYRQARQETQFQPTSPVSISALESIGGALEASKIPPYLGNIGAIPSAIKAGNLAKPVINEAIQTAKPVIANLATALRTEAPTMSGVGAAVVPEAATRTQMAQQLRVPVPLSKGQATRELGQQQFEIETMKTYPKDVGRPLIQAQIERNDNILRNFDAFVDATGAQKAGEFNLREVGKVVDSALVKRANEKKAEIKAAYNAAKDAGETSELIDVNNVKSYLNGLEAEAINAPIITSAKMKLDTLAPDGKISINDLEEVRKMVGKLSGSTPTNATFGKEINGLIDSTTADKGGELYKNARKLRANYAREFENVGYVDRLLSKKPGTTDRSVALEDVFDHAILKGSLDDVKAIGYTLKKAGPEGQQAFQELRGQTIEHLKSAVTKNIQKDEAGNPIVSPKQFDTIVKDLDSSGKLNYLFGKAGAQEIRNLRDTAITVYTQVPGINTSNTSSALTQSLNGILKKTVGKVPFGGAMVEAGVEAVEKKNIAKKVKESLEYNPEDMAKQLKKGK